MLVGDVVNTAGGLNSSEGIVWSDVMWHVVFSFVLALYDNESRRGS